VLLDASDAGEPAHTQLQDLARRKLRAVDELIARAQRVRDGLDTATGCGCQTLDFTRCSPNRTGCRPKGSTSFRWSPGARVASRRQRARHDRGRCGPLSGPAIARYAPLC